MINKKPNVAVLLAAYNGKKYIHDQIISIINQKDIDVSLFINIDKSNDGTEEYVKILANKYKNINILECGNTFNSASKNFYHLIKTVDLSLYDYISFSDQDDIWNENKITMGINNLKQDNSEGYSSNVLAYWNKDKLKKITKSQKQRSHDHYFESAGPGCTYILSNKLAISLKEFIKENEKNITDFPHHDWMIYAYSREHGFKWTIDKNYTMYYRQHDENELGVNIGIKAFLKRLKQVFSGVAIRKHIKLSRLLNFNNYFLIDNEIIHRKHSFHFFLNSAKYRRNSFDQLLFKVFWMVAFVFGLKPNSQQINFLSFFHLLIPMSLFFVIYLLINQDNSEINFYNLFNFVDLIFIIIISVFYNLITSKRIILTLNFLSKKKLKFFSWNNFFVQGQIIGYLIPQSGVIYRALILKDLYGLSYLKYIGAYILLISTEIFLLSLIFLIFTSLFFFSNSLFWYLIIIPSIYLFVFILFIYLSSFKFKVLNRISKKISIRWLRNVVATVQVVFSKVIFNKLNLSFLVIYSLLKIILGLSLYFLIIRVLENSIGLKEIIYFFTANQIFEPVKITPQNLGIMELIFGFIAIQIGLSIKVGVFTKVIIRFVDMISLILLLLIQKILQIFLFHNKNSLI